MQTPDWTTFRAADGSDPCGPCCLMEKVFDLSNLPRNYIWTLGYLGEWPEKPEFAEVSAQVKSYSRQWLMEREQELIQKRERAQAQQERMMSLKRQRDAEDAAIAAATYTDTDGIRRRIEAGPLAMAKSLAKAAADLTTGGVTDPEARLEICDRCPFKGDDSRCGKCGCYLPAKTRIRKASCPIGLW